MIRNRGTLLSERSRLLFNPDVTCSCFPTGTSCELKGLYITLQIFCILPLLLSSKIRSAKMSKLLAKTVLFILNLCCLLCRASVVQNLSKMTKEEIVICTLLPFDPRWQFSMMRVKDALSLAVEKVTGGNNSLLVNYSLVLEYRDSNCSISDGMNEAVNAFVAKRVHTFFGPVCDYSAAPVGRQTKYWKIPLLTVGALASEFATKKADMYPMLTRLGPSFDSLTYFLVTVLQKFKWRKVLIMYDQEGQENIVEKLCYLASTGIHTGLRVQTQMPFINQDQLKVYKNEDAPSIQEKLKSKISNEYANGEDAREDPVHNTGATQAVQ